MRKNITVAAVAALAIGLSGAAAAETLRASHQWPGGTGDMRDEMVQIIAKEMEKSDTGVKVRVYPGESLVKAKEQWGALTGGQIDISAFPLAYAAGRHPEFNATLMPALVKSHEHAQRLNTSEFMQDIKAIMDKSGVMVLADTWLAGGFAGKERCILSPEDVKGESIRAAGSSFEEMLAQAGASIASMPSSEIYTAMQTGVLDAANTSSESFVSYRIYEQVACLTPPGETALWFMYEPIIMSKASFEKLSPEAQEAMKAAGKKAEEYAYNAAKEADQNMVDVFKKNNVEIATMSQEQFQAWRDVAAESSYKKFAESVPGGQALIDKALAVD
jgi:TRAP-type C4-dicarboxylate transport system substrate-binding protein